jgi:hypothetical protein
VLQLLQSHLQLLLQHWFAIDATAKISQYAVTTTSSSVCSIAAVDHDDDVHTHTTACMYTLNCTAYDCKEDCALYALDSNFLVVAGYKLNALLVSQH